MKCMIVFVFQLKWVNSKLMVEQEWNVIYYVRKMYYVMYSWFSYWFQHFFLKDLFLNQVKQYLATQKNTLLVLKVISDCLNSRLS